MERILRNISQKIGYAAAPGIYAGSRHKRSYFGARYLAAHKYKLKGKDDANT